MKKLLLSHLLLLSFLISFSQIQQSNWILQPNKIDFTVNPVTSTAFGTNTFSYTAGNSAFDQQGNLLFYIRDWSVYDANSNFVGDLSTFIGVPSNVLYSGVLHEIAIVPFDETCQKFYIIFLAPGDVMGGGGTASVYEALMYSIVEMSGTTVNLTSFNGTGLTPPNPYVVDLFSPSHIGGIAVSPKLEDGSRFLFAVAADEVNRYKITDTGVNYEETIATINDFDVEAFGFDLTELELFWEKASD